MPWRETSPMDQRQRFVGDYYRGFVTFSELCARYSVSRRIGYKWVSRFEVDGPPAGRSLAAAAHKPDGDSAAGGGAAARTEEIPSELGREEASPRPGHARHHGPARKEYVLRSAQAPWSWSSVLAGASTRRRLHPARECEYVPVMRTSRAPAFRECSTRVLPNGRGPERKASAIGL